MGRNVDQGKRVAWRRRLARHGRSRQTVAAFCAAERVSVATFYQWKRKLARVSKPPGCPTDRRASPPSQGFWPVRIERPGLVEIELPNGVRVRIAAHDLAAVGTAVAAAGQVSANQVGEAPRC